MKSNWWVDPHPRGDCRLIRHVAEAVNASPDTLELVPYTWEMFGPKTQQNLVSLLAIKPCESWDRDTIPGVGDIMYITGDSGGALFDTDYYIVELRTGEITC